VVTIYLKKNGKSTVYTFFSMIFVLGMTLWAMVSNVSSFYSSGNHLLLGIGSVIFILALWLCLEAWLSIRQKNILTYS
jgi:carbon starvation protein